ncbi:hypothetical protein IKG45_03540 [Candidatus Saccharibacteria bacterium]|nr:hypothetical protein [Candidatus Saccharibacteria bacterium]
MSDLKNTFLTVFREERGLFVMMILNFLVGMVLLVFSLATLNPDKAAVKIGYGDIGGYRDGTWIDMLTFPILAILFGILHNILALKIFERNKDGIAKVFVAITFFLLIGAFVVLSRLLGEG